MTTIAQQFSDMNKMPLFELQVIDKRTNEIDYILFDLSIQDDKLVAQHVALSTEQQQSNKIAFVSVDIDEDFNLDSHLETLLETCNYAILESEFFTLAD